MILNPSSRRGGRLFLAVILAALFLFVGSVWMQTGAVQAAAISSPDMGQAITPAELSLAAAGSNTIFMAPPITPTTRPLGSVTSANIIGPSACARGTCFTHTLTISCTQLSQTIDVDLEMFDSSTGVTLGTIFFGSGFTGDFKWSVGITEKERVLNELNAAGYRTVEAIWSRSWWEAGAGQTEGFGRLACQPATALQYINDNLVGTNQAMCGTAHSNGGGMLAYPMSQYNLENLLTTVIFESGPNWSRVDEACLNPASSLYFSADFERRLVDSSLGFGPSFPPPFGACWQNNASFLTNFEEASLSYNNWDFIFPNTFVSFLYGATDTNIVRQHALDYEARLTAASSPFVISTTIAGAGHNVGATSTGADYMINHFKNECTPPIYYVANNASACGSTSPCLTGTTALQQAVDDLPITGGTVYIHGDYLADPGTTIGIDPGRDITVQGIAVTATVQSSAGACSGPFFTVANGAADVVIQNVTLDGDANCTSGSRDGIEITGGTGGITLTNIAIQDTGTAVSTSVSLHNTGNSFSNNSTAINITGGDVTIESDTFTNNVTAVFETSSGNVVIGSGPTTGSTFTGNTIGISSDGGATIKGNSISGGTTGISLLADAAAIYGNSVTGASGQQIDCTGSATDGAGFNYLGGNFGSGSTCGDLANQIGAAIQSWTEGTSLNDATSTAGPIFDLGNGVPFGFTAPQQRNSSFYAVMSGNVTISGPDFQFKMFMDGAGCSPMTPSCWDTAIDGRSQIGPGYFYNGQLDPTAVGLSDLTAAGQSAILPLFAVMMLALLLTAVILKRTHTSNLKHFEL